MNPRWSPDGKWVSFTKSDRNQLPHVWVMPATGGEAKRITGEDSYSDGSALWTPDGKYLAYLGGIDVGNSSVTPDKSNTQIYVLPLLPDDKDRGDKGIDSEEDAAKLPSPADKFSGPKGPPAKVEVKIDWNKIGRRARQLTKAGDNIADIAVSPDGKSVVYITSGTEGGKRVNSIWSIGIDAGQPARVVQGGAPDGEGGPRGRTGGGFGGGFSSPQFSKDGKSLYYKQGKNIYVAPVAATSDTPTGGKGAAGAAAAGQGATGRKVAFSAKVEIDHRAERHQVFLEAWRVMKNRFYDAKMHGTDWAKVRTIYEPLLVHVADQEELHDVISMMLGELNASHTGISGAGKEDPNHNSTRHPGFEMEPDKSGWYVVKHIYKDGPSDKGHVKLSVGDYIVAFNGQPLKAGDNYWKLFTHAPSERFEFTVNSKPTTDGAWTFKVQPIDLRGPAMANLQYEKWVDERRATVERITQGKIGYLHIRQMDPASLKRFERDLAMLTGKDALIIDQRFNPGGNIDQELLALLQQKQYQKTQNRGSVEITRPLRGFFGPMVVMANERSTSDAEVFPDGFRTLKLGKVVGVTTYGAVIGTGAHHAHGRLGHPHTGLRPVERDDRNQSGEPRHRAGRVCRQFAGGLLQQPGCSARESHPGVAGGIGEAQVSDK